MASTTVEQPAVPTPLNRARVDLALLALYQIEALLPLAQHGADGYLEADAMLGLLGRMRHMNDIAMELLGDDDGDNKRVEALRVEVRGRREELSNG